MKKGTVIVVLCIVLLAYILLRVFIFKDGQDISADVLFLTLLAIAWYSRETSQLRVQSQELSRITAEHTELTLKPHLEVIYQRMFYYLYNIGNGPALNTRIEDVSVDSPGESPVRLTFQCSSVVKKEEYQAVHIDTVQGDQKRVGSVPASIIPPEATKTVEITIHYENLVGRRYEQKLQIGKGVNTKFSPIDTFLYYLYLQYPKGANPKNIPPAYLDQKMLPVLINYCMEKSFIDIVAVRTDQEGIVDVERATLKADGIDYLLKL